MERVVISVEKYKAKDGKLFDTQTEVIDHELRLSGSRKTCPQCRGTGKYGTYEQYSIAEKCDNCKGKGYLDKEIIEVWN